MKVSVTQDDINQAPGMITKLGSRCANCPIALAMSRVLNQPVTVSSAGWRLVTSGNYTKLPEVAEKFMLAFDKELPVAPFEFEV